MAGCSGVSIPGDVRGGVGKARFVRAEAARVNLNRRTFGAAQAREVAQRLGLPEEAWRSIPAPLAASTDEERRGYPQEGLWLTTRFLAIEAIRQILHDQGFETGPFGFGAVYQVSLKMVREMLPQCLCLKNIGMVGWSGYGLAQIEPGGYPSGKGISGICQRFRLG